MICRIRTVIAGILLAGMATVQGFAGVTNGTASVVLGASNFTTAGSASTSVSTFNGPNSVAVDTTNGRVYVADTFNNRILWWADQASLANGQAAAGVIGQTNFTSGDENQGLAAPTAATLSHPSSIALDAAGRLWVADASNNRVLRFDTPTASNATASVVLGQNDLVSNYTGIGQGKLYFPLAIAVDAANNVWVVDEGNNRVVGYTAAAIAAAGLPKLADYVIGAAGFDTRGSTAATTASSLNSPQGICVDVSSNVWIADDSNNRFLRFSSPFSSSGMTANLVLGQADMTNSGLTPDASKNRGGYANAGTIHCAMSISGDKAGNIWVADYNNNRILRYGGTLSNGKNAVQVIGQANFTATAENRGNSIAANSLFHPNSITVDSEGNLWISEGSRFSSCHSGGNNRVLKFNNIKLSSLSPSLWHNGGKKQFTITGDGIASGTVATLRKAGQSDIVGTGGSFRNDETLMYCTFDLTNAAAGTWDLVLNIDGIETTLAGALTIVAVTATGITPASALNNQAVSVTIAGENFFNGIVPALTKSAQTDITATNVVIVSSTQMTCRFDIIDVTTGFWNVVVAGNGSGTLANAFEIHFPSSVARNIVRTMAYRLGMETERGIFTFTIPAGAFSEDVFFSAGLPSGLVRAVSESEFKATEVAIEVLNDKDLQPVKSICIGFHYKDSLVDGFNRKKLAACYCDETTGRWIPVSSCCDKGATCVQATTLHLCVFRLVELVPGTDLSGIKVYPNPYTPGSGDGYDNPLLGNGIAFAGLTGNAKIKIFTIAGELVLDHAETDGTGFFVWDTKNDDGDKVASGTYVYLITSTEGGSGKKKGKLAIVR